MFSAEEGEKALGETGVRTGILPTVEVKDEVKDEVPQSMQVEKEEKQSSESHGRQEHQGAPSDHYQRELINAKIDYGRGVFSWVKPDRHQIYVAEVCKAYEAVTPFRIRQVYLHAQCPQINRDNYFDNSIDENKALMGHCVADTNQFGYYLLSDVYRDCTTKEFYQVRQLANDWKFTKNTRSLTLPNGRIFAINCRTTSSFIDPYFYEITDTKASNRGTLPTARRDSSFIYLGQHLYVIGGKAEGQKSSRHSYKYNLKTKKWSQIAECSVGLCKPTLCVLDNRYILKMCGLNQFDYISKTIQVYDSVTDCWINAHVSSKNALEEVQFLEGSLAVQINEDQIYVFGGRNSNKCATDTSFILTISEIRERHKSIAKIAAELWNISAGKRTLLSLAGCFSQSNVIVQHNSIHVLRSDVDQAICL